jgi:plasmid stabilization system protein ParE
MKELILRPRAEYDVQDAALWYEAQRVGLGLEFLEALDYVINRITNNPLQFPEIQSGVRRGLLHRFPYSVYFVVIEERVEVIAVLHLHRHPDSFKSRL